MTLELILAEKLRVRNTAIREFLGEFMGTFVLMVFGLGANASKSLRKGDMGEKITTPNPAWGIAVAMGLWVSIGVSGGHINPAFSLAMAILGRLRWKQVPVYMVAQYLSAFVASACVYGIYYDALNNFDGGIRYVTGVNATAGIWATYPAPYLSIAGGFCDQVFCTTMLFLCVLAVTDHRNIAQPKTYFPVAIGLIVFLIGMSFDMNGGSAMNPARDLSPRIFTAIAGWGVAVFTVNNYWFWVPIVGPHIGALLGALIYLILIGFHFENPEVKLEDEEKTKNVQLRELNGFCNQNFEPDLHETRSAVKTDDNVKF